LDRVKQVGTSASIESIDEIRTAQFRRMRRIVWSACQASRAGRSAPYSSDRRGQHDVGMAALGQRATWSTTAPIGTERELPRRTGSMQNVQRWSQPFCTLPRRRAQPVLKTFDQMPRHLAYAMNVADRAFSLCQRRTRRAPAARPVRAFLSSLSDDAVDLSHGGEISLCVCAAQPSRRYTRLRPFAFQSAIDCRACSTASLVTAQLLMTMVSEAPALRPRRSTSDSKLLRRSRR